MAWTQDTIEYKSQYYEVPAPYEEGIRRWPPAKTWTAQYGAPGEVDEEGVVRRVCVIPKPYTHPHPPIWQPFSVSEATIRWCAREGIVPWILIAYPPAFRKLCEAYREEATQHGRELALGESVGAFRSVHMGNTYEEAFRLGEATQGAGFVNYFGGFGFFEAFRFPGEEGEVPANFQRMVDASYSLVGTVDDVKRQMEELRKNTNPEWFGWFFDQGLMPWDEAQRQLEIFATKVMPEFRD
jgi:alkanesulfonate monooxygenase SsuD/methylene tetrahydromethanopterin reductase-like flavin-dependent oxidoreductase (luciferase family)